MTDNVIRKLTSRKFWLCVAAFLGSIGASIAGLAQANESVAVMGTVCAVVSAAIYAAAEAYVDGEAQAANTTATVIREGESSGVSE